MRHVPALALLLAFAGAAAADPGVKSADEIKRALSKTPTRALTTRQIEVRPTVALTVTFALGSSQLTPQGTAQLDELARALQSPELAEKRYVIDGHTDAKGKPESNLKLSERRAASAKAYLVDTYGIADERLVTHGYGDTRLANPKDPYDGANRRVEVTEMP